MQAHPGLELRVIRFPMINRAEPHGLRLVYDAENEPELAHKAGRFHAVQAS